jgi:hypothetical protein
MQIEISKPGGFSPDRIHVDEAGIVRHDGRTLRSASAQQLARLRELATEFVDNGAAERDLSRLARQLIVTADDGSRTLSRFCGRSGDQATQNLVDYLNELVRDLQAPDRGPATPGW